MRVDYQARLLIASLAFLMLYHPTIPTARGGVVREALNLKWRIQDQNKGETEGGQLVQTNKLSSDLSTIQLELKSTTHCELSLYDLKGNHIQNIEAEQKNKGKHLVIWKHTDVAAGTYLLTLCTDYGYEQVEVRIE